MKSQHSNSLILVWQLAEFEARHLNASTIEPIHLLLALCKVVDVDLPSIVSKDSPDRDEVLEELLREARRLRTVFRVVGLDAKNYRRRLRRALPKGRFSLAESDRMRRSKEAKGVFADAEHFATLSECMVYPVHLLYAVLRIEDEKRDELISEFGVDKRRLQEVTKREVLFQKEVTTHHEKKNKGAHLN